jgi:hypothetical protein
MQDHPQDIGASHPRRIQQKPAGFKWLAGMIKRNFGCPVWAKEPLNACLKGKPLMWGWARIFGLSLKEKKK